MITQIKILIILLAFTLAGVSIAYADTATVMGKITAEDNKPLVKVIVSIGDKFKITDIKGRYRIKNIPYGSHTMQIKRKGEVLKEVEIEVNKGKVKHDEEVKLIYKEEKIK